MMKKAYQLGALGLLGCLLGCGAAKDSEVAVKGETRIVNLLNGISLQGVNISKPEELAIERLAFGGATPYKSLPFALSGKKATLQLTLDDSAGSDNLTMDTPALAGGKKRTWIVFGEKGATNSTRKPTVFSMEDPAAPASLDSDTAAVRVVSVSPDIVAPIDLYLGEDIPAQSGQPAQNNARPVFGATNITRQNPTEYVRVPSGDTKLGMREKGVLLPLPTLAKGTRLLGGEKYLLIVFGYKRQPTDPPETVDMLDAVVVPDAN